MFNFWSGDHVAGLVERYMLNEYVFSSEDRTDLRKALALAGEIEYEQRDLHRLFLRQLGLEDNGEVLKPIKSSHNLIKALQIINLSSQIFSRWSEDENNLKQALTASERAMLWSWHRIQLEEFEDRPQYYKEFGKHWQSYKWAAHKYFQKLQPHFYVRDGLSGYCRENAQFSLVVFEQIGLIASIGLSQFLAVGAKEAQETSLENANVVADGLVNMLKNNPVSGSPRLDNNVVDIVLGMLLLFLTGNISQAQSWLAELVKRVDYTLKIKRNFPICTDSPEDLVEVTVFDEEELKGRLMRMSWLLPTLAGWAVILDRNDLYEVLSKNTKNDYPEICLQLWHPTTQEFSKHLYFHSAQYYSGESEAPIILPDSVDEYRTQMEALLKSERHNVVAPSTAAKAGILAIDLIASRHFKTPIAPFFWYQLLQIKDLNSKQENSDASQRT